MKLFPGNFLEFLTEQQRSLVIISKGATANELIKDQLPVERTVLEDFIIIHKAAVAVASFIMILSSHHVELFSLLQIKLLLGNPPHFLSSDDKT